MMTPTVLLPWDNAVIFQQNLARHDGPLATWTAWVVPSTMSVSAAASKLGMSESELRSVNNIPPRMQVRAGSSLLVHRTGARDRDVPEHVADNAMLALQPDVVLRRTTVKARKGETGRADALLYDKVTGRLTPLEGDSEPAYDFTDEGEAAESPV